MRHLVVTTALMVVSVTARAEGERRVTPVLTDRVVAVVDETPVLLSEVRRLVAQAGGGAAKAADRKTQRTAHRLALERLIERRLIEAAARRKEISVQREQVDAALKRIADDAGMTREELLARVSEVGFTEAEYRQEIEAQLLEWMTLSTIASERGDEFDTYAKREKVKRRWLSELKRDVWVERRWRP